MMRVYVSVALAAIATGAVTFVACSDEVTDSVDSAAGQGPSSAAQAAPPSEIPETTTEAAPTPVDADEYRGQQPGSFYFVTATSKFECGILAQVEAIAGCHGNLPSSAPPVPGSGSPQTLVAPNAIKVSGDTAGKFYSAGDPQFHRFEGEAQILPYGRTLVADGFVCSVDRATGVTCESKAGHGFTVSDTAYEVW